MKIYDQLRSKMNPGDLLAFTVEEGYANISYLSIYRNLQHCFNNKCKITREPAHTFNYNMPLVGIIMHIYPAESTPICRSYRVGLDIQWITEYGFITTYENVQVNDLLKFIRRKKILHTKKKSKDGIL